MTTGSSSQIDAAAAERLAADAPELSARTYRAARLRVRYNATTRATFYKWLSILLARGQSLDEALATLYHIETNGGQNPAASPLARVIPTWISAMKYDGEPLTRLLKGWIPPGEYLVLSALAKTGLTAPPLAYLAKTTKRSSKLVWSLFAVGSQLYLTICGVVVLAFAFASIVPDLLLGIQPRFYTANIVILLSITNFFTAYGVPIIAVIVALPIVVVVSLARLTGRWRDRIDQWPLYRQYRDIEGAVMLRAVGSLITAGRSFFEALDDLHDAATPYLRDHIEDILLHRSLRPFAAMRATGREFPSPETITTLGVVMEGPDPANEIQAFADEWQTHTTELVADAAEGFRATYQGILYALVLWLLLAFNDIFSLTEKIQ
jgi:hypothetical protein